MATINCESTADAPVPLPVAKGTYGHRRVIVSDCPYCHKEHTHSITTNDGEKRMGDCMIGEYIVSL